MPEMTTIEVSAQTLDALRELAHRDGRTLDAQILELIRQDRRLRIGRQLASDDLSERELMFLNAAADDLHGLGG